MQILQIGQEGIAINLLASEKGNIVVRKVEVFQIINDGFQAREDRKAGIIGVFAIVEVEITDGIVYASFK